MIELSGDEISELKRTQDYKSEDIVVLSETMPNLQGLLGKIRKEQHHIDNEVRFEIDGGGVFTARRGELILDFRIETEDLVVVPANTRDWFDLDEQQKIKCIWIFNDPAGWEAVYE